MEDLCPTIDNDLPAPPEVINTGPEAAITAACEKYLMCFVK